MLWSSKECCGLGLFHHLAGIEHRHFLADLGNDAKIVVQNKPGAGGAIGFGAVASAPADGYTIGFINTPNVLTVPIERKSTFTWQSFDLLGPPIA